jgi:ech hydrogenase subunit D
MPEPQEFRSIRAEELVAEMTHHKQNGWRLTQILATHRGGSELLYTLERDYDMQNLRVPLAEGTVVDSVTSVYPYAYLYENEMKDLFGVEVRGLNVDFGGHLYTTAVPTPFREPAGEEAEHG